MQATKEFWTQAWFFPVYWNLGKSPKSTLRDAQALREIFRVQLYKMHAPYYFRYFEYHEFRLAAAFAECTRSVWIVYMGK